MYAPEEIDRIEQLVDALLGSPYAIARGNRTEEGVLDANTICDAPYNVQVNQLQQRLHGSPGWNSGQVPGPEVCCHPPPRRAVV